MYRLTARETRKLTAKEKIMVTEQETVCPGGAHKLPQDQCGDECCGEIGANSRALKHALSETPMQSDQIVMLANAVRLLAFHVERVRDEWQSREELRGIRDDMEGLIYTIKGRR